MEKVLELGIFHFSVYTFQGCGRQEINSFVLNFWYQVSEDRDQMIEILNTETRNLEWLEFLAISKRRRETA